MRVTSGFLATGSRPLLVRDGPGYPASGPVRSTSKAAGARTLDPGGDGWRATMTTAAGSKGTGRPSDPVRRGLRMSRPRQPPRRHPPRLLHRPLTLPRAQATYTTITSVHTANCLVTAATPVHPLGEGVAPSAGGGAAVKPGRPGFPRRALGSLADSTSGRFDSTNRYGRSAAGVPPASTADAAAVLAKKAPAIIQAKVRNRNALRRLDVCSFSSCFTVSERAMVGRLREDSSGEVSGGRAPDEGDSVKSRCKPCARAAVR